MLQTFFEMLDVSTDFLKRVDVSTVSSVVLHKLDSLRSNCRQLQFLDNVHYLGVSFYSDMPWNTHMLDVSRKFRSVSC